LGGTRRISGLWVALPGALSSFVCSPLLGVVVVVVALLIVLVPIGKQDSAGRPSFLPAGFLAFLDRGRNHTGLCYSDRRPGKICRPTRRPSRRSLRTCRRTRGLYPRALDFGPGVSKLLPIEELCLFHAFESVDYVLERLPRTNVSCAAISLSRKVRSLDSDRNIRARNALIV